ncbi:MAG: flagellar basal-body rod protein FlgF, partial [Candidatus Omnitrophica bacterium]|nr:flagellar basal-body rod protein FlgF [Candidatus Omnitrophota bacterium]
VPTDLAIEGEGFFAVRTPRGERYTRNGTFKLVPDSQTGLATITTADGYPLLGANGPIQVPVDQDFEVDQAGNVLLDGLPADRVRVVELEDRNVLLQESSSLFQVEDRWRDQVHPAERSVVRQGTLEKSNVNTVLEMVRMIESFRNYESAAKVVSVLDRSLGLAVNQIAGT